jgi:hypothetical protein
MTVDALRAGDDRVNAVRDDPEWPRRFCHHVLVESS